MGPAGGGGGDHHQGASADLGVQLPRPNRGQERQRDQAIIIFYVEGRSYVIALIA